LNSGYSNNKKTENSKHTKMFKALMHSQ